MRILLLSQYFWPESFMINDLVKELVTQGHTVQVLTGKPNYPEGKVFQGYTAAGCDSELYDKTIPVYRVPLRPRKHGGGKNLILNYCSFVLNGLLYFNKAVDKQIFDVVLVYMPSPITAVIPAIYLKWRQKIHLAVWVQDLWPESLQATGFIQNKYLLGMTGWMVRAIYKFTDTLLLQSKAFFAPVLRYTQEDKIVYYPNSYIDNFATDNETISVKELLPNSLVEVLEQHFCLTFAGNLGKVQALETMIAVAEKLKHIDDLRIVLVGSGSMSDWLADQKRERQLDNVVLAGRFPSETMPAIFKRSQGLIVSLKKDEIFSYTIPSKVQAYLAAGRPIIASFDGEGARIIEESKAGLTSPAEDVDAMLGNIEQLYSMTPKQRDSLGLAGRKYYLRHFEMKSQCERLVALLEARIKRQVR